MKNNQVIFKQGKKYLLEIYVNGKLNKVITNQDFIKNDFDFWKQHLDKKVTYKIVEIEIPKENPKKYQFDGQYMIHRRYPNG
jgi:hypothetical protein